MTDPRVPPMVPSGRAQAEAIVEALEANDLEASLTDEIQECLASFYRDGYEAALAETRRLLAEPATRRTKPYDIEQPAGGFRSADSFTAEEKRVLRPIAETLAMLDGNAFFTLRGQSDAEWYEAYLSEADALFQANGGLQGWAGQASFALPPPPSAPGEG